MDPVLPFQVPDIAREPAGSPRSRLPALVGGLFRPDRMDFMSEAPDLPATDLNGFVSQLESQMGRLSDDLTRLIDRRESANTEIKAKRAELAKIERLWRATQPRKSTGRKVGA